METKDLQNSEPVQNEQQNASPVLNNAEAIDDLKDMETAEPKAKSKKSKKKDSETDKNHEINLEEEIVLDEAENFDNEVEEVSKLYLNDDQSKIDVDFNLLERDVLVEELRRFIETQPINQIRREVEAIKASFYKKQKAINEINRKQFIKDGGNIEDYIPVEDPLETELKELFKKYRKYKAEYNRSLENVKETNLERKYAVIEKLKDLITNNESIGDTFQVFRELQLQWKEIGPVPQSHLKDLWNTYHHHVEKFYDFININKELRDLDLKKNLEIKTDLCEKAEKLIEHNSVVIAFKTLQKLHNQWREIGPISNEQRDAVWERFKEATRLINKKHQDYFKNLKDDQKNNLEQKSALCEKAEEISNTKLDSHKDWTDKTQEILDLQKAWRAIGFAPKKDNNRIYARFRNACDKFFTEKREFYSQNKELQDTNLERKIELCVQAELIQESTDWKQTTKDLIDLQKKWKEIGPVPRKQSDKVWKRFRAACDHFFNRKSSYYSNIEEVYDNNLKLKLEIIEKVKNFEFSDNPRKNFESLKKLQDDWSEIGFVPFKMKDKVQNEFRELINQQFDKLKIDDSEKKLLKFQSHLENLQHKPKSSNKIRHEREKFFTRIKKLESNITLWENNLGFFNSDSAQAKEMINDYMNKIEEAKKEIKVMEDKIRLIDKSDNE
ncbi:MAG: hypothetical protein A2X13_04270 [Bacteroidetes bacterium GWC2_33_15]|nr:MAG: hypothetical protein A2X10_01035 [Bacteroidetes bacterium GWA2_33_15]OFX49736.1 MAG: hypothetical protein A2X13_04270 [Bacteroidetes bacterium GWC2_33_15]OFX65874.1 MAG: hypothetical protein A2X15_10565 [Bacteroidetes bacterium GWB2_32_14]OFX68365.1 MAG: hypothetical protein A2X14_08330 [Bacteroidetes bacterium GWD2_33_33]HAN18153.1 DUF349 domain-containing protein [Bacteroidales bacterium]